MYKFTIYIYTHTCHNSIVYKIKSSNSRSNNNTPTLLTRTMTSRVANARISAQETLFLHSATLSTAALALITVSNPSPANDKLSTLSFSALFPGVDAIITDASHPYTYIYTNMY